MKKLTPQELVNEFKKLEANGYRDISLSHIDYLLFVEADGHAFVDKYINTHNEVIKDSIVTLCDENSDVLKQENKVFLYFHIAFEYEVEDVSKHITDIVYDACHPDSDIAFSISFDKNLKKDYAEVTMIVTGVQ